MALETIGVAYMVVGGVPEVCTDHPARVVAMALDMLEAVTRLGREMDRPLDLRIGVHSGPAVAGVIGTRKFIFDLWGDRSMWRAGWNPKGWLARCG
jgi:class 3 adenylate cyclase